MSFDTKESVIAELEQFSVNEADVSPPGLGWGGVGGQRDLRDTPLPSQRVPILQAILQGLEH